MLGETERTAALEVALHAVAGQDDGDEPRLQMLQGPQEVEPAAVGQADIANGT